jgi:uroporphyrinogen-III decarboxylase
VNSKERVHATLGGRPVDRFPVTAIYHQLVYDDHFAELTGEPAWQRAAWHHAEPDGFLRLYKRMVAAAPFELMQPISRAPSRELRERIEFVERDGQPFRHDRQTDEWQPVADTSVGEHAHVYHANEEPRVRCAKDIPEQVHVGDPDAEIAAGANDYLDAAIAEFGADQFILSGGVTAPFYKCSHYLGLTNLYAAMLETPELVDTLIDRLLEQDLAEIRRLAAAGGDGIFLDDATATSDMISVRHYERFCLPHTRRLIDEIHALGHKAIVIYFGGIADRLEPIASLGADGLVMECSMKGYVNDIDATVESIGDRITLFSNIDPVGVIQSGTPDVLRSEIARQCAAGRKGRGFVVSPSSPITPATRLERIQQFLALAKELGVTAGG